MTRGGGVVVRLKGLHKVRRKLSDGSYRTHYYAWRGGPRVEGEAGTPEFIASYNRAVQDRRAPLKNSFASVVSSYKRSARHLDLVSKSRTDECRYLDAILDKFGAAPIRAFDDARMRKDVRDWHSKLESDRSADMALGVLRKVLDHARDDGFISLNPAAGHRLRYSSNRTDKIWSPEKLELICSVSSPELARVILLSAHSGIARTDLCKLTWSQISENAIQFNRSKTGELATVPIYREIRSILDSIPKISPQVLTNTRGRPWTPDGLGTAFDKAKRKAGITDLRFHDLRGTAVTFLYAQGLSDAEVADIVGWSEKSVSAIKKKYVSRETVSSAMIARLARTKRV